MIAASQVLRDARQRSRLTQAELGRRADVPQSVISAYESARREPSVDMLVRLVAAAGFDLRIGLTPAVPKSRLQVVLDRNRLRLRRELQELGASNIRVFGSVARGEDTGGSDVLKIFNAFSNRACARECSERETQLGFFSPN